MKYKHLVFFLVFIFSWLGGLWMFPDAILYEQLTFALLMLLFYRFLLELSYKPSVRNLIALIAVLQWLFGAVLGYHFTDLVYTDYTMVIPKEEYFGFVFPATLAMVIGLYIMPSKINVPASLTNIDFTHTYHKGVVLVIIGFAAGLMPFLGFLAYLLSGLKYIGIFYIFFSRHYRRYWWVLLVFGSLFLNSLGEGMFHDLLLWGTFFVTIYFTSIKSSLLSRISFLTVGFIGVMVIQLSKSDIREVAWGSDLPKSEKYVLGAQTLIDKLTGKDPFFSDENIGNQVVRLNQGWIISHVMANIPDKAPFAKGETVSESIIASIFPRFLLPNKGKSGGKENMEKYAGITMRAGTSMDISQVGEAYANFGKLGGVFFMFILGLFFGWINFIVEKKSMKHPELLLWIPLLFLQVVKAETSLITILNHFTKAALLTWFFFTPWGQRVLNMWLYRKMKFNTLGRLEEKPKLGSV